MDAREGDPNKGRSLVGTEVPFGHRPGQHLTPARLFEFVAAHQALYPVTMMCRVLGISRSGYYAWQHRPLSARSKADAALQRRIEEIHEHSRGTYGRPRIHAELASDGVRVSPKRIARLMRLLDIEGVSRRKELGKGRAEKETAPAPLRPRLRVTDQLRKEIRSGSGGVSRKRKTVH